MRAVLEEEEGLDADAANNSAAAASDDEEGTADGFNSGTASAEEQVDSEADAGQAAPKQQPLSQQQQQQQQQQPQIGERRGEEEEEEEKKRNQRHGDVDEGSDSDTGSRQQAAAPLDPLAAELEALGLAGKASEQRAAAADSGTPAAESTESELDEEAMLERLVGSRAQAAEASGDSDDGPARNVMSADADARDSDAEAAGSGGEGEASAAEGMPAVMQGAKSRRAKVQGRAANGQAAAMPVHDRGSAAAAAEVDGKPMTKRQKRKQKGGQTVQVAEVPQMACGVCGLEFESRTQLFKHIACSGHALLKA